MPLIRVQSKLTSAQKQMIADKMSSKLDDLHVFGTHWFSMLHLHDDELETLERCFIPLLHNAACVLDIGCNAGEMLKWMRRQNPHAMYHGIDLNEAAIELARSTVLRKTPITVEVANALEYNDYSKFDLLYTWNPVYNSDTFYPVIWDRIAPGTVWYEAAYNKPLQQSLIRARKPFTSHGDYVVKL